MYPIKTVYRLARWLPAMAIALAAFPSVAADAYPTRPLRFVVPYAAGGAVDVAARMIGRYVSEQLGQQVVVENKPGAGASSPSSTCWVFPPMAIPSWSVPRARS